MLSKQKLCGSRNEEQVRLQGKNYPRVHGKNKPFGSETDGVNSQREQAPERGGGIPEEEMESNESGWARFCCRNKQPPALSFLTQQEFILDHT